ncbi:hypothetical protein VNI00_013490 [Paramarasmius palmivorus]|uniref:Zn(2)-C6 fungal-type domain-containing protein n=1 Tax=Paramarasmius palmivorus TaxID=297713 RepID=A0AAW0BW87_9AGAR
MARTKQVNRSPTDDQKTAAVTSAEHQRLTQIVTAAGRLQSKFRRLYNQLFVDHDDSINVDKALVCFRSSSTALRLLQQSYIGTDMPQYYPASQVLATISRMGHIMDDQGLFTAADRKLIWTKTSLAAALKDGLTEWNMNDEVPVPAHPSPSTFSAPRPTIRTFSAPKAPAASSASTSKAGGSSSIKIKLEPGFKMESSTSKSAGKKRARSASEASLPEITYVSTTKRKSSPIPPFGPASKTQSSSKRRRIVTSDGGSTSPEPEVVNAQDDDESESGSEDEEEDDEDDNDELEVAPAPSASSKKTTSTKSSATTVSVKKKKSLRELPHYVDDSINMPGKIYVPSDPEMGLTHKEVSMATSLFTRPSNATFNCSRCSSLALPCAPNTTGTGPHKCHQCAQGRQRCSLDMPIATIVESYDNLFQLGLQGEAGLLSMLEHRREIIASQKRLVEVHNTAVAALKESDQRLDDLAAQIRRATRDPRILIHILRKADPEGFSYTEDHINCLIASLSWPTDQFNCRDYEVKYVNGRLEVVALDDQSVLATVVPPMSLEDKAESSDAESEAPAEASTSAAAAKASTVDKAPAEDAEDAN